MKIGITTFGGDGGKSGISRYITKVLAELAGVGAADRFEVMVYEDEQEIFLDHVPNMSPLCFSRRIRNPVVNVAWHQFMLPRWCRKRSYDVLFLPAGNRRLPLSAPCPTVGTVHDFSSLHVDGKYDPARMFYITRVLPALVRRLTRVIAVSESTKRDIVEYAGVPEDRVTVTHEAVDHDTYFPRDRGAAATQVAAHHGVRRPYVLYISRIEHPGKNHVRLIRAFERLKASTSAPHQLVLAGSDWNRAEAVHEAAAQSACAGDIVFTGFVPGSALVDLYCGADAFVFPSLYEGFGLPVLEAMACGTPVACSNISSMPEVAGDAAALFDPYDEDAIQAILTDLLTDNGLRNDLARRGIARSKEFTWAATAAATHRVLAEAAAES